MPRIVSIDLGAHAAKLTVYKSAGRKYALEGRWQHPVPQDGAAVPNAEARLAALDALLDEHPDLGGSTNDVCALAWPGDQAVLRRIHLPFTDAKQIEKTLPFSIEAEVPFDLDDMVMGWRTLSQDVGTEMLVALARRDRVSEALDALTERKLEPRELVVDAEVLSTWADAQGVVVLVDIGHGHTGLAVVRDGRVVAGRTVNVAGYHFTRALQMALKCSWDDAEGVKHGELTLASQADEEPTEAGEVSAYDALPQEARAALDGQIGLLLAELRSTLIAVEDDLGMEIDKLVLSGGGARLAPLPSYLQDDLGLPVEWAAHADGEPVSPEWAVADGLSEHQRGQGREAVDLRTGDLAFKGGVDVLEALLLYGGAGMAFFTAAAVVLFVFQFAMLSREQSTVQADLDGRLEEMFPGERIKTSTEALNKMRQAISEANTRADALGTDGKPPMVDLLHDLTASFPPPDEVQVDVTALTLTPAAVAIDAETDSYAAAEQVEASLQQSDRFSEATKGKDTQSRDKIKFSITIPLEGGEEQG